MQAHPSTSHAAAAADLPPGVRTTSHATPTAWPAPRVVSAAFAAGGPVFGAGVAALGVVSLLSGAPVAGLAPIPPGAPGRAAVAVVTGLVLVVAGAALTVRARIRHAASAVAAVLWAWFLVLHVPRVAGRLGNGGAWTVAFETAALAGAACVLAATRGQERSAWTRVALVGRWAYGVAMVVFGVLHLVYHDVVAALVPAWIPGPLFWAYFTGAAHLATGLAVLAGVWRRPAGLLAGLMFGLWVLIVHAPRLVAPPAASPGPWQEWTSLLIALAMCGASWVVGAAAWEGWRAGGPAAEGASGPLRVRRRRARGAAATPGA